MTATNGKAAPITRRTPIGDLPDLLTAEEAAAWLGLARNTIFELARRGDLKSVRLGRLVRIPKSAAARCLLAPALDR